METILAVFRPKFNIIEILNFQVLRNFILEKTKLNICTKKISFRSNNMLLYISYSLKKKIQDFF